MSSFKITKTIGLTTFEFTEEYDGHQDLFRKASFFSSLPIECGTCKGKQLTFEERKGKDKDGEIVFYYEIKCRNEKCGFRFQYGEHRTKEKKTLFSKGWEAPYSPQTDPFYDGVRRGGTGPDLPPPSFAPPPEYPDDEPPAQVHKPLLNPSRELIGSANEWKNHPSTEQQRKALWALAKQLGHDEISLKEYLWNLYGERAYDAGGAVSTKALTKGMISEVIDRLKSELGEAASG